MWQKNHDILLIQLNCRYLQEGFDKKVGFLFQLKMKQLNIMFKIQAAKGLPANISSVSSAQLFYISNKHDSNSIDRCIFANHNGSSNILSSSTSRIMLIFYRHLAARQFIGILYFSAAKSIHRSKSVLCIKLLPACNIS